MEFRINVCEKHYGFVDITADSADTALEKVPDAVSNGDVTWTNTVPLSTEIAEIKTV